MKTQVGDATISPENLGYRPMGFGEPIVDRPTYDYELQLSLSEFAQVIKPAFDEFVEENRQDDEETDYEDVIPELREYNYAQFDVMIQEASSVVCKLVTKYLYLEFLEAAFGKHKPEECTHAINSIKFMSIENETVKIGGEAYAVA